MGTVVGVDQERKESWSKVTGQAKYTDDLPSVGYFSARLATSPHGHARIKNINTSEAENIPGVKAVVTGADCSVLTGPLITDRPPLARDIVRYAGEPVAIAVAVDEATAELATRSIHIEYEPLPGAFTVLEALDPSAPLVHEHSDTYKRIVDDVFPQPGTNISGYYPIRKGDIQTGWAQSEITVTQDFYLPPSAHIAMEVRTARASIARNGVVSIETASQSPFSVIKQMASAFQIPAGNIEVHVPFVGGGFGGKAPVMLEILAYIASRKAGGAPVRLIISRAQDIAVAPCRAGLYAKIKLGATSDGVLRAMEMYYWLDNGAYADIGPYMAKAVCADCTGPYHIENVYCDVFSVYTNHTYATSFRGFAHESHAFCVERAMDLLALQCGMDPLEIRRVNAIRPGQSSPTQVKTTSSNVGDLTACIDGLKPLVEWNAKPVWINEHTVRAKGAACIWKSANPPTDAVSGAMVTFNKDGSLNLNTGVVEMGNGGQSTLAQMLADRLGVSYDQVHVVMDVNTRLNPEHYKTVASLTSYIAGRAVMRAADDILAQLRAIGAQAFCCGPEDIVVADSKVYARQDPEVYIHFKDIVMGYKTPDGTSLGDPVLGKGGYMLKGLSGLDPVSGMGKNGPAWTLGAQAVEVEVDVRDFSYRIVMAGTVMDVGKAVNPKGMSEMIRGGMSMGLSMASREAIHYDANGLPLQTSLRNYKLIHIGEEPEYRVAFVETPQEDAPYGVRSMSEHGIIGMPAALANALASATGILIDTLPVTPEYLWNAHAGGTV